VAAEVGSPGPRAVRLAGPPQHQTTSLPGRSAVGLHPSAPPSLVPSSTPLGLPSLSPSALLLPLPWSTGTRLWEAAWGLPARHAVEAEMSLMSHLAPSDMPLSPSLSFRPIADEMGIRWGASLGALEIVPTGLLLLLFRFSFRSEVRLRCPAIHRRIVVEPS